jgi:hypothetical protein
MRKTFPLDIEGRHRDRTVEAAKHDIRKYIQRERRKALPSGADFWDFDCRFGADRESARPIHFAAITPSIDEAARSGAAAFHIEIVARAAQRSARPDGARPKTDDAAGPGDEAADDGGADATDDADGADGAARHG